MTTFKVLLTPYPVEFIIEAESEDEAYTQAKNQFNRSVWEKEIEEVKED